MVLALAGVFVAGVAELRFRFNKKSIIERQEKRASKNVEVFGPGKGKEDVAEAMEKTWDLFTDFRTETAWYSTGTVALLVLLALMKGPGGLKQIFGAALGVGALFYPMSWFFAGLQVAQKGPEGALRALRPMATITQSFYMFGLIGLTGFFLANLFRRDKKKVGFSADQ